MAFTPTYTPEQLKPLVERVLSGESLRAICDSSEAKEMNVGRGMLRRAIGKSKNLKQDIEKLRAKHSAIVTRSASADSRSGARVLVIPDLHSPWHHVDALDFLREVKRRYHPTDFVCLGDEIDAMGFSRYPQDPDAPNQGKELELAIAGLEPFYREFLNMKVCESNHTIRPWKRGFDSGLPQSFLPTVSKVLRAPDGWEWRNHWEIDGVRYIHGDAGSSGFTAHIQYMRKFKQSVVIGHIHSYAGVNYEGRLFGMNTGCLIDQKAICFKYAKNMPIPVSLGCGMVFRGLGAIFIPMILDENDRWIGRL